ncbi:cyclic nucleotide-binding domain-containing protein [Pantanalinema rosaneae CENA516]|uniref:cyclic nucleotide-binding domain-containing protein n=1 Tax=Pantanalinema rosaneae TaxID=1620701 RepID=UPI003D6EBD6A
MPAISIRRALPILLITPLIATVGLTGWLAYRGGQQSVEALAIRLSSEVSYRIKQHVNNYIDKPQLANRLIAASIRSGNLDPNNLPEMERFLWHQIQSSLGLTYIYYGNPKGHFVGVQVQEDGSILSRIRDDSTFPGRTTYKLDQQGNRASVEQTGEKFDPLTRPWYKIAIETGKPTWSPVFKFSYADVLGITATIPVYTEGGNLQGVLANNVPLEQLSKFLQQLNISPAGEAFIMERSGELIASSTGESPVVKALKGTERISAIKSTQPLIQATAKQLYDKHGDFSQLENDETLTFPLKGENQFVHVARLIDEQGLDWLVVVVVPEADFMEKINVNTRHNLLVGLGIAGIAVLLGLFAAQRIIQPLERLSLAAKEIESGYFSPDSLHDIVERSDEVGQLARVINEMATVVYQRERQLQSQLQRMQSETDRVKRAAIAVNLTERNHVQQLLRVSRQARGKGEELEKFKLPDMLRHVTYFQNLTDPELKYLFDVGYKRVFRQDEYICQEGEDGDAFYIILVGSVEVFIENPKRHLRNMAEGTFLGELALLLGIPRTATVRALEDSILFVIDRSGFQDFLNRYPQMANDIALKINEYQSELEQRKELLKDAGLIEDETSFSQSPLSWIRRRMKSLFNVQFDQVSSP